MENDMADNLICMVKGHSPKDKPFAHHLIGLLSRCTHCGKDIVCSDWGGKWKLG